MRLIEWRVRLTALSLVMTLCASVLSACAFADDGNTTEAAPSVKLDAPRPGLTEREQWLLDRVEQLEKRVEELEPKSAQPAGPEPPALQPATNGIANSAATAGTT